MALIIHSRRFHRIVRFFHIQPICKKILHLLPIKFHLSNGIVFRIKSPESFSTAKEIFRAGTYDPLFQRASIRSFVDLGCNTGYIPCLLAGHYQDRDISGILVDADPEMVEESRWHLQKNNLLQCQVLWGLVGPDDAESCDFNLSEYNITSSALPFDDKHPIPLKTTGRIRVPILKLDQILNQHFGDQRVDLLKIDIEGSEKELLQGDLSYLRKVNWIVLEWHKWIMDLDDVVSLLNPVGFCLSEILKEDNICGLAMFKGESYPG